jgi:hypothetical protein
VGGGPGAGDPPVHCGLGAWLLRETCNTKKIESCMFNNRDSVLNTKYIVVSLTCELSTCGVDGSLGVVG